MQPLEREIPRLKPANKSPEEIKSDFPVAKSMWSYTTASANGCLGLTLTQEETNEGRPYCILMLMTQSMYRQQNMELTFETLLCQKELVQYTTSATFNEEAYVHTTYM